MSMSKSTLRACRRGTCEHVPYGVLSWAIYRHIPGPHVPTATRHIRLRSSQIGAMSWKSPNPERSMKTKRRWMRG